MGGKGTYHPMPPLGANYAHIFGRQIPKGVKLVETTACADNIGVQVFWTTSTGRHSHFLPDLDDDNITALLVAMRLTCS